MAATEVERVIKRAFKHLGLKRFMVLDVDTTGHYLSYSEEELDGQQAINRRGALYICEVRGTDVHTRPFAIVRVILVYIQEVDSSSGSEFDERVKHTLKKADKVLKKLKVYV